MQQTSKFEIPLHTQKCHVCDNHEDLFDECPLRSGRILPSAEYYQKYNQLFGRFDIYGCEEFRSLPHDMIVEKRNDDEWYFYMSDLIQCDSKLTLGETIEKYVGLFVMLDRTSKLLNRKVHEYHEQRDWVKTCVADVLRKMYSTLKFPYPELQYTGKLFSSDSYQTFIRVQTICLLNWIKIFKKISAEGDTRRIFTHILGGRDDLMKSLLDIVSCTINEFNDGIIRYAFHIPLAYSLESGNIGKNLNYNEQVFGRLPTNSPAIVEDTDSFTASLKSMGLNEKMAAHREFSILQYNQLKANTPDLFGSTCNASTGLKYWS